MKYLYLFYWLLFTPLILTAQSSSDCVGALELCFTSNSIKCPQGYGNISDLDNNASCIRNLENNSIWLKVKMDTAGELVFDITTLVEGSDYDFAVYNMTNDSCQSIIAGTLSPIRCSFAALPAGPTGLAPGNNDFIAGSSGPPYLAPIAADSGDVYYILIDNFTHAESFFQIHFATTPLAPFDSCRVYDYNSVAEHKLNVEPIRVYPNPARNTLHIESSQPGEWVIYNLQGQAMLHHPINAASQTLDISTLPAGMHFYQVVFPDRTEYGSLLIE